MHITDVVLFELRGPWTGPVFPRGNRQAQSLDIYPEFNQIESAVSSPQRIHATYVQILTDTDISGLFGPIEPQQTFIIKQTLRPFLIGRDPLAIELLLDQMIRMNRHGRSGMFMTAVSAIDCALWDLKGKAWDQPVYRLLGGPTRPMVPAYASMLGFSTEPAAAAETALAYQEQGYTAQKWFFRHGPGDGSAGIERNLALAEALRAALGPHYRLMFDAFMGWDLPYAIEMVRGLAPLRPTWVEEPIPPEHVGALRQIRQAAAVPIATGEHVYTRWQVKELLVGEAVDVLQVDPDWRHQRAGEGLRSRVGVRCAGDRARPLAAAGPACGRRPIAADGADGRVSAALPGAQAVLPRADLPARAGRDGAARAARARDRAG
jgi:L-rhamnonate dehydratase